MHSETFRLGNHPSRHRKERDDAALLTQEGNSPTLTVTTESPASTTVSSQNACRQHSKAASRTESGEGSP